MGYRGTSDIMIFDLLSERPASAAPGQVCICLDTGLSYIFGSDNQWTATVDKVLTKLTSSSGTPTITLGSAAGTGATSSITGNNISGKITINTGVSIATNNDLFTLTLADSAAFKSGTILSLAAMSSNTPTVIGTIFQSASNVSSATVRVTGVGLAVSTTYTFAYTIGGY